MEYARPARRAYSPWTWASSSGRTFRQGMCTTTTWRFMMSRRKMRLYVDWDAAWAEDAESLARLPEPNGDGTGLLPSTEEAIALVHYVFRSSIILDTRAGRRELLKMTEFSRLCKSLAVRAGADAGFLAEPPLPSWARSTVNGLRSYLRPTYPQVDEIKVVATLDNRLHVRSFHSRHEIQISVITRAVLRTMNLMIWNHVEMASREPDPRTSAYSGPQLVDVFGFTLPLYRDIPWNQAPFLRAAGPLAAQQAIIGTRIQMAYMLAPGLLTWERAEAGIEGFDVHFRVMDRGCWRPECAIINA